MGSGLHPNQGGSRTKSASSTRSLIHSAGYEERRARHNRFKQESKNKNLRATSRTRKQGTRRKTKNRGEPNLMLNSPERGRAARNTSKRLPPSEDFPSAGLNIPESAPADASTTLSSVSKHNIRNYLQRFSRTSKTGGRRRNKNGILLVDSVTRRGSAPRGGKKRLIHSSAEESEQD